MPLAMKDSQVIGHSYLVATIVTNKGPAMTEPSQASHQRPDPDSAARVRASLSFDALYDEHFGFVWRTLRALGLSQASLDDALHDVFLAVHQSSCNPSHLISVWKWSRRCPRSPGSDSGNSLSWARNFWKARCSGEFPAGKSVIVMVSRPVATVPGEQSKLARVRFASAGRGSSGASRVASSASAFARPMRIASTVCL